jgi:hypothetical protein
VIATEGERDVMINLRRKAEQADKMFAALVQHMNESLHIERSNVYEQKPEIPTWL